MSKAKKALQQEMSTGIEDNNPYWKPFKILGKVNNAIIEAYKLGYLNGFKAGHKSSKELLKQLKKKV